MLVKIRNISLRFEKKMKRKNTERIENPKHEKTEKKKTPKYVGDPKLLPRVEQYLQSCRDKKAVNLSTMATDLQARYSEYARKKKNAFRKAVEKAYLVLCREAVEGGDSMSRLEKRHLDKRRRTDESSDGSDSDSSSGSFSSDNPDYVQHQDSNAINSIMSKMYKQTNRLKSMGSGASTPTSQPSSPKAKTRLSERGLSKSQPASPVAKIRDTSEPLYVIDRVGDRKLRTPSKSVTNSPQPLIRDINYADLEKQSSDVNSNTPTVMPEKNKLSEKHNLTDTSATLDKTVESIEQESATPSKVSESTKTPVAKKVSKKSSKVKEDKEDKKKKGPEVQQSTTKFADVGGNEKTLSEVCKLLVHMKHPEVYQQLGIIPPRGFLLHGPPGCGKTLMAHAIAGELELPFIKLAATEVVSGVSGESEEKLRDIFDKAVASAPCVLFIDEIDAITQKRETASKDMERRIVSQLLTCMDDLNSKSSAHVLVIGATNRPDSLDPALRRAGRFDREIALGIPDEQARKRILEVLCKGLKLEDGFDYLKLARLTPGFVGADLVALAREAAITAVNRVFSDLQNTDEVTHGADTSKAEPLEGADPMEIDEPVDGGDNSKTLTSTAGLETKSVVLPDHSNPPTSHTEQSLEQTDTVMTCDEKHGDKIQTVDGTNIHQDTTPGSLPSSTCDNLVQNVSGDMSAENQTAEMGTAESSKCDTVSVAKEDESSTEISNELNRLLHWLKDQPPLTEEQLGKLCITMDDFEKAVSMVQPSAKREGFATIPDVTWDDIGALKDVREELQMAILAPVQHPEQFKAMGLTSPPGVLLAGPPGCGKTLLAKAVANESGINFISVKGPELLNMYVGESERAVRQVFQRARNSAPCVIFFDELDALCPRRSDSGEGGSSVRVVNQLLTEMDGLEARKQVFIMGATNRPDIIDPAIMRPGRLDKVLYVGLPGPSDRLDILRTITKNGSKPQLHSDVDLQAIAENSRCQCYTGADLAALVREAAVSALREYMANPDKEKPTAIVCSSHFDKAFIKVRPSVSPKDQHVYEKMKERLSIT